MIIGLRLTAEQIEVIRACGSEALPIAGHRFHVLSQQRRIFYSDEDAVVVRRPSGFLETHATLQLFLSQHGEALRSFSADAGLLPASEADGDGRPEAGDPEPRVEQARRAPDGPAPGPTPETASVPASAVSAASEGSTARAAAVPGPVEDASGPPSATMAGFCATGGAFAEGRSAGQSEAGPILPDPARDPIAQPNGDEAHRPAVPIEESVHPDHLVCLEDGRKMKMLTRHIREVYGMSPEQYRARWSLPPDYPMVAPETAERRLLIARQPRPGAKARLAGGQPATGAKT